MDERDDRTEQVAPLSWRIRDRGGAAVVEFSGELDENCEFGELRARLRGRVVFHLAGVRRINSCGVREWVNFVRDLSAACELTFTHCSPAIVTQLNMIYNFRGNAKVESFVAPYMCVGCGHEEEKLIDAKMDLADGVRSPPRFVCDQCGLALEFDDVPERYLSFLKEG
jgi:anti-anti-sigma regulatory factor